MSTKKWHLGYAKFLSEFFWEKIGADGPLNYLKVAYLKLSDISNLISSDLLNFYKKLFTLASQKLNENFKVLKGKIMTGKYRYSRKSTAWRFPVVMGGVGILLMGGIAYKLTDMAKEGRFVQSQGRAPLILKGEGEASFGFTAIGEESGSSRQQLNEERHNNRQIDTLRAQLLTQGGLEDHPRIADLRKQLAELQGKNGALAAKNKLLKTSFNDLKVVLAKSDEQYEALRANERALKKQTLVLKGQGQALKKSLMESAQKIKELEGGLVLSREEAEGLKNTKKLLESLEKQRIAEIDQLQGRLASIQSDSEVLKGEKELLESLEKKRLADIEQLRGRFIASEAAKLEHENTIALITDRLEMAEIRVAEEQEAFRTHRINVRKQDPLTVAFLKKQAAPVIVKPFSRHCTALALAAPSNRWNCAGQLALLTLFSHKLEHELPRSYVSFLQDELECAKMNGCALENKLARLSAHAAAVEAQRKFLEQKLLGDPAADKGAEGVRFTLAVAERANRAMRRAFVESDIKSNLLQAELELYRQAFGKGCYLVKGSLPLKDPLFASIASGQKYHDRPAVDAAQTMARLFSYAVELGNFDAKKALDEQLVIVEQKALFYEEKLAELQERQRLLAKERNTFEILLENMGRVERGLTAKELALLDYFVQASKVPEQKPEEVIKTPQTDVEEPSQGGSEVLPPLSEEDGEFEMPHLDLDDEEDDEETRELLKRIYAEALASFDEEDEE